MCKFRIFLTFPVFIWLTLKCLMHFRRKEKNIAYDEKDFYNFTKRYSGYLLWLYGQKLKTKKIQMWNKKNFIFITDKPSWFFPLILMKLNNFEKTAPLSIITNEKKLQKIPKLLRKFYSLINFYVFQEKNKLQVIKNCIENIQIPRSLVFFFDFLENEEQNIFFNIITGSYVDVILCKEKKIKKTLFLSFVRKINIKKIIISNKKVIRKKWKKIIND